MKLVAVRSGLDADAHGDRNAARAAVIADCQLAATREASRGGAEVALMNPGGVRTDLTYAASPTETMDGVVTFGELFTVQPFGNSLVVMTLTGAQIDQLLEQQFRVDSTGAPRSLILQVSGGFTYAYSQSAPVGSKAPAPRGSARSRSRSRRARSP